MKISIRKTFKYRLYRCDKRDKHLHDQINIAGIIWNHMLALQKRYYRLTNHYCHPNRLKKHIARLRMHTEKYSYWQKVGS